MKSSEPVVVNGIKLGNTLDKALSAMGDDYEEDSNIYTFKDGETGVELCKFVFRNDILITVVFNFK